MNFYKLPLQNVIIIYDDIDLEKGKIRIRKKGGPGGHNGMKSLVYRLQSEEFPRIRVGTGFCENKNDMINYVISKVSNDEYIKLMDGINVATKSVTDIMKYGIDVAMNKNNTGRGNNKC